MYKGLICNRIVVCRILGSRLGMFIVVFLWCMHKMRSACGSRRDSLLSSGDMVGFVYVTESGGKYMIIWVSSNEVLYGVSFVVQSSSGTVRMVIVSGFSYAARQAQCMAFYMFFLLCG